MYSLPMASDPNNGDIITIAVTLGSASSFVTYLSSTKTFTISPLS